MAYTYSDANGHLSPGPSINGLRELKALIVEQRGWKHPALSQLLEHGHTNMLPALSAECRYLIVKTDNYDIQSTLTHLASLCLRADEMIVLEQ